MLATDDHALGNVALRVSVMDASGTVAATDVRPLFSQRSQQWSGETMLSLRGVSPGTTLRLVAVATDGPRGADGIEPRSARARTDAE